MTTCAPWATDVDLCGDCQDYAIDSSLMEEYLQAASDVLYTATAQQFPGICETEPPIRPCTNCSSSSSGVPYNLRHLSSPSPCGCADDRPCGRSPLHRIELPFKPVVAISQVKVNGSIIDPSLYWVQDSAYLVRLPNSDGTRESWPHSQYPDLPDTFDGTFSVTYSYGREPPILGRRAAAILACEFYMACNPEAFEGQCKLPRNVVSIVRQGVSVAFESAFFTYRPGRAIQFGVPEIDMFISSVNPYGLTSPSVILSPDSPDLATQVDT